MSGKKSKGRRRRDAASLENSAASPAATTVRAVWIAAALCAMTYAVYSGVLRHQFIDLDDSVYIYQNPEVSDGFSWKAVEWALRTGYQGNWHPLTWFSHMLDVQLFGLSPGPHHAVNLLLHMLNTVLLFVALDGMTGARWRSAFVAALFAVHPLHVESVAWAAERKDVLSTFFWMSALCAYVAYVRRPGRGRYAAVAVLFALGLMSKPMLVTFPMTLLLLDYWPLRRFHSDGGMRAAAPKLVAEKLPLIGLSIVFSIIALLVQKDFGAVTGLEVVSFPERIRHAFVAFAVYLDKALWPAHLALFYPYDKSLPVWMTLGSVVLVAGISLLALSASRARPYFAVGWLWFLGALVPVIGLVQVGQQAWADRYMYVPLIGLGIIASWGGSEALAGTPDPRKAAAAAASIIILALAVAARWQVSYWQDRSSIWSHTLEVTTDNLLAELSMGTLLSDSGRLPEAVAHLTRAVGIRPDSFDARINLGLAFMRQHRFADAVPQDRIAVRLKPDSSLAHSNLGLALIRTGPVEEAARELQEALRLDASNRDAQQGLDHLARARR